MADEADKRSVHTDALATLGKIIDETQKRDAIHLAVEPVIAGEDLKPGQHITVENGIARKTRIGEGLGIVDPFLPKTVMQGERFWFVMYPRTIRSLRHVWSHPAFPDEAPLEGLPSEMNAIQVFEGDGERHDPKTRKARETAAAEAWLRQYAQRVNHAIDNPQQAYETLMDDIRNKAITYRGTDMHSLGDLKDADELRENASIVLGHEVRWEEFEYFSCSC